MVLCELSGILCIILGVVIWILDLRFPELVTNFFGVDPLQDDNFIQGNSFISIICHFAWASMYMIFFVYYKYRKKIQMKMTLHNIITALLVYILNHKFAK